MRDLLLAFIVVGDTFTSDSLKILVEGFKKRLGAEVQVVIEQVLEIPAEKSGKFRYIVSHVAGAARS